MDPALMLLGALAITVIKVADPDEFTSFFSWYIPFAFLIGIVTSTGGGVGSNAYFEVAMAAGPSLAYGLHNLSRRKISPGSATVLVLVFAAASAAGPSLSSAKDMFAFRTWAEAQSRRQAETLSVVRFVSAQPGPVICQVVAYCIWAGKGMGVVAPFNFSAAVEAGRISDGAIVKGIANHYYSAIVVPAPGDDSGLTPGITGAMRAYYKKADLPETLVTVMIPDRGRP
jgi:hypothetical protein